MEEPTSFESLGLSKETLQALSKKGFEEPTSIQRSCIPTVLQEQIDVVGQAQTGTGKTAAFGLPILESIDPDNKTPQALILAPTRELALQVSEEISSLKSTRKIEVAAIYGGQSIGLQIQKLRRGVHIVVGTPGRVIDLIDRKALHLNNLSFVVLDEADEMLNMGFIEDIERILQSTPEQKRMLLFSATMPRIIMNLAKKYMGEYRHIVAEKAKLTTGLTDQIYFEVREGDRLDALCRIIDMKPEFYGVVFCRTKIDADAVAGRLQNRGYDAEALHGDITQAQREKILGNFRKKNITILVATDVAARGIDVQNLTHVINYTLPQNPESYVHRIGRTGRAGKEGTAITFISPFEYRNLCFIQKIAKTSIRRQELPKVQDIIDMKKDRIRDDISHIIEEEKYRDFRELSNELCQGRDPLDVVAALLQSTYAEELNESNYRDIKQISVDRQGTTRLFVAKGRKDGMSKRSVVEFIEKQTSTPGSRINNVQVYDAFSFITVPFDDAEAILLTFKKMKQGRKPLVTRARK
ncbi:DEAD/DEAH box helicase [Desulfurispira natronophila]|uniref:DEAD-box ATP-dependent RNA helicase RhpA n=1 Tax=Desulfurispira natronophila TaxID=682562 RepID=A0A7W8DFY5_9BACT|nr:ATP-dependent RNA helicase DeaD [Desulfurispira natronophila]